MVNVWKPAMEKLALSGKYSPRASGASRAAGSATATMSVKISGHPEKL
jgi:hypothetical protein